MTHHTPYLAHLDDEHAEDIWPRHDFTSGVILPELILPESCLVCGEGLVAQIHAVREDWTWLPT